MYLKRKSLLALIFGFFVSQLLLSCVKVKDLSYLQDVSSTSVEETVNSSIDASQYKLAPNDIISIKVVTHDINVTQMYNVDAVVTNQLSEASLYLNGYSLDLDGSIDFPNIGKIMLAGLTIEAASLNAISLESTSWKEPSKSVIFKSTTG